LSINSPDLTRWTSTRRSLVRWLARVNDNFSKFRRQMKEASRMRVSM
jgi:hypothetical protein